MMIEIERPEAGSRIGTVCEGPGEPGLVSVIIPTYNRAHLIGDAIDSVLGQSYRAVELIVVDDGSSDATREVVGRYGDAVRCFHQANAGVAAARNLGYRAARGEFVALLDSDDAWLPWKLEAQVAVLRARPEVVMVWSDMTAIRAEDGTVVHPRYLRKMYGAYESVKIEEVCADGGSLGELWSEAPPEARAARVYHGDLFSEMILGSLVHTSTTVLRRETLQRIAGFDESLRPVGEDYEFHLRTCFAGPVALLDTPTILYRIGDSDQLTAPHLMIHIARHNVVTVHRWLARGADRVRLSPQVIRHRLAYSYGWLGEEAIELGQQATARAYLFRSLRLEPVQRRRAILFLFSLLPRFVLRSARGLYRSLNSVRQLRYSTS